MHRKSILAVILSTLTICFTLVFSSQVVLANTITIEVEEYAMYPYPEVKQDAIKALRKAESTLDWDDIVCAWIKVDGLTMHPDYNGDTEVNALNQKVDDLFSEFATKKSQQDVDALMNGDGLTMHPDCNGDTEVYALNIDDIFSEFLTKESQQEVNAAINSQSNQNTKTTQPEKKSEPIQTAPVATTNDNTEGRKITRAEEKVTVRTIPASSTEWGKYTSPKTAVSVNTAPQEVDVSKVKLGNLGNKNSSIISNEIKAPTTDVEAKETQTVIPQSKINEESIIDVDKSQDNAINNATNPEKQPSSGILEEIAEIIVPIIKALKSM